MFLTYISKSALENKFRTTTAKRLVQDDRKDRFY